MNNIWYAFDYETSDTNPYTCDVAGLGLCRFEIDSGDIREMRYETGEVSLVSDSILVAHNAKFDVHVNLKTREGRFVSDVHDTLLMAKHINNLLPAYDLKSLAWWYFGEPYLELLELKNWFRAEGHGSFDDPDYMDMTLPPVDLVKAYCLKDVEMTARLAHLFYPQVKDNYAYEIDRLNIMHTVNIEARGLAADLDFYREYKRKAKRRIAYNTKTAQDRMSTKRKPTGLAIRERLAELGETRKTKSGMTQADEVVMRDWRKKDKAVGSVERIKKDTKAVSTYVDNILNASVPLPSHPEVGIFHINLMQSGAVTRRYRSAGFYSTAGIKTKGNSQNFSPPMREGVVARPGYEFWKIDLASIEARMFSAFMEILMGESTFADMYRKNKNFNPYLWVVEQCAGHGKVTKKHELYTPYKHGVLGRLYCSGVGRFAIQLRDKFELDYSETDCSDIYGSIDRHCPFIKRFQRFLLNLSESQGYLLDPFGARYVTPSGKPYEIIAHLHQGAAGNVLKWWVDRIVPMMRDAGDHIVNLVHDETDNEILKKGSRVARVKSYCDVLSELDIFDLPIVAEATRGSNWMECG